MSRVFYITAIFSLAERHEAPPVAQPILFTVRDEGAAQKRKHSPQSHPE
jgi:hypothetical protein